MDEKIKFGKETTFAAWLIFYLSSYIMPVKPATCRYYWDICFKHLLPSLGQIELRDVTSEVIRDFLHYQIVAGNLRTGGPLSEKSVMHINRFLRMSLKQAFDEGVIEKNPFA